MRHGKAGKKFNRDQSSRKALMKSLACALIEHGCIQTTVVKAKELRRFIEPLVTRAKVDSVANRRHVFAKLRSQLAVKSLFESIGPLHSSRPGGYVRVLKSGSRQGDASPMAYALFVDQASSQSSQ